MDYEFSDWREIVETLYEGEMTRDPRVRSACEWFIKTSGDPSMLQELLDEYPSILSEAKRNIMLDVNANKENPFYPDPHDEDIDILSRGIEVGKINRKSDFVGIRPLDFTRGFFICGAIGSGKSYPVFRILKQILSVPKEDRGFNVIIIQTSKKDMNFLFRDHAGIRVLWSRDILYSPFNVERWDSLERKRTSFVNVFRSVNWLRHHSLPMFNKSIDLAFERNAKKDVNLKKVLDNIVEASKSISIAAGLSLKDTMNHLAITLHSCVSEGGLINSYKGFPVDEFFSKEDLILNLYDTTNEYAVGTFLGTLLNDLKDYYTSLSEPTDLRTLVVIDECRSLFPKDPLGSSEGHNSNQAMENFVTTRRSSGIGLIAITQEPRSVPTYLTSNSNFLLAMKIGGIARKDVKDLMNLNDEQTAFFDKLPKFGVGIMRHPDFERPFWVKIPGDVDDSPISENAIKKFMEEYVDSLHLKYSYEPTVPKVVEEVDDAGFLMIDPSDIKGSGRKARVVYQSTLIIEELSRDPFIAYTDLRTKIGLDPNPYRDAVDLLLSQGLAEKVKCIGASKKPSNYLVLTKNVPGRSLKNPLFFRHILYQKRIEGYLVSNGYSDVEVEYYAEKSDGKQPKSIIMKDKDGISRVMLKRIDVFGIKDGKKHAFEVSLTFSNLLDNIHKCLGMFKVDRLHLVTQNPPKKELGKNKLSNTQMIQKVIDQKVPAHLVSKISIEVINDYCMKGNI